MQAFINFIIQYAHTAHWFIFVAILLAGINIPISIDLIVAISAILSAKIIPEHTVHLFLSVLLGSLFSAWIAYWVGRTWGLRLCQSRLLAKIFPPKRLEKLRLFYEKHGLLTLIIGRFIPFGVRNCLFMTTGMSKLSFSRFMMRDALACFLWVSLFFYIFYSLGQTYEFIYSHIKIFNLFLFGAFSVTVIGTIWYKRRKKGRSAL